MFENKEQESGTARAKDTKPTPAPIHVEINWTGDDFLTYLRRSIRIRGVRDDRHEP